MTCASYSKKSLIKALRSFNLFWNFSSAISLCIVVHLCFGTIHATLQAYTKRTQGSGLSNMDIVQPPSAANSPQKLKLVGALKFGSRLISRVLMTSAFLTMPFRYSKGSSLAVEAQGTW